MTNSFRVVASKEQDYGIRTLSVAVAEEACKFIRTIVASTQIGIIFKNGRNEN